MVSLEHKTISFLLPENYPRAALSSGFATGTKTANNRFVLHRHSVYFLIEIIAGDLRERRHFFCRRTALKGSSSLHRKCNGAATRDGSSYWKLTGKEKKIVASGNNRVIGMRRKLAFYQGKDFDSAAPQWIMHELRLLSTRTGASDFTCFGDDMVS